MIAAHAVPRALLILTVLGTVSATVNRRLHRPVPPVAIIVRPVGVVSADAPDLGFAEPWLAVDPRNPAHSVAVAIVDSGTQTIAYATSDGGGSWRRGSNTETGLARFPGIDPVVVFDDERMAFLATISPFRVWRSSDGGLTWHGPALVPGRSYDREYLAIRTVPNAPDTIYALAKTPIRVFGHLANDALAISRSTAGQTFDAPRLMLPDPGAGWATAGHGHELERHGTNVALAGEGQ